MVKKSDPIPVLLVTVAVAVVLFPIAGALGRVYYNECVFGEEGFAGFLGGYQANLPHYIVHGTVDGSPAQMAGFKNGDAIISMNGKSVNPIEFENTLHSTHVGDIISLGYVRSAQGFSSTLTMTSYPKWFDASGATEWLESSEVRTRCVYTTLRSIISPETRHSVKCALSLKGFNSYQCDVARPWIIDYTN